MPPHIVENIRAHLETYVGQSGDALLFSAASDPSRHLQPSAFHKVWSRARLAAGRPDLRGYDPRHTGATFAAMAGATLAELQQRLGHSTVGAALRYQHARRAEP